MNSVSLIGAEILDESEQIALDEAILQAQIYLSAIASDEDFLTKVTLAFGDSFDAEKLEGLRQQWVGSDFGAIPAIQIRSASEINGANGAFSADTNTIYLAQEYIVRNTANPQAIVDVLLEEIGHSVDLKINASDAPGDEGAIFSALVRGEKLDEGQLQQLKVEDDTVTITLDGQLIEIEQDLIEGDDNQNRLYGTSNPDFIFGYGGTDILEAVGNSDLLVGGLGDDFYTVPQSFAGTEILDEGGEDSLTIGGVVHVYSNGSSGYKGPLDRFPTLSLSRLTQGLIGFGRDGTSLVIDLNQDGQANLADDLTIKKFFVDNEGYKPGIGFIERIGTFDSRDILNLLRNGPNTNPLWIEAANSNFEDTDGDGNLDAKGTIYIGRTDGISRMLRVENATAEYDAEKLTVTGGTVYSVIGNVTKPLFKGNFEIPFNTAAASSFQETGSLQNEFQLSGLDIDFKTLALNRDGIGLGARFKLPDDIGGVIVDSTSIGPNTVFIRKSGVSLGTSGKISLPDPPKFSLFKLFDVEASDLSLEYIAPEQKLKLQGKLTLDSFTKTSATKVVADLAGDNFIEIKDGKADIKGSLAIETNLQLPKGVALRELKLNIDTQNKDVGGSAKLTLPFGRTIQSEVELGFKLPIPPLELNQVSLDVNNLNLPIPQYPLVFFQRFKLAGENFARSDSDPVEISLGAGVTLGPQILGIATISFDGDVTFSSEQFTGAGTVTLINTEFGTGTVTSILNWNKKFYETKGKFSILGGSIKTDSSFKTDLKFNINMSGNASGSIPKSIPLFGGATIASGKFLLDFSNDNNLSNDFAAAWGTLNLQKFGIEASVVLGIKKYFDGRFERIGAKNVPSIDSSNRIQRLEDEGDTDTSTQEYGGNLEKISTSPRLAVATYLAQTLDASKSFDVAPNTEWILLGADWENEVIRNVPVKIKAPDGTIYTEADFSATNGIAIVDELTDSTTKTVIVFNPKPGVWNIEVANDTDLGNVQFTAARDSVAPTVELTAPVTDVSGSEVTINYNAFDADSNAEVKLFYDNDNQGFDGIQIASGLAETDGAGSFVWNTEGVPTGDYYVYGMVMDENNAPTFSYSQGRVQITEEADLSVTKTANAESVGVGNNLTYTITVTNNGLEDSKGITLTETLPEGVTFVSASRTSSQQPNGILSFDLGNLTKGSSTTVDVIVTPTTAETITSSTLVTSKTFDPDATNDVAILATTVIGNGTSTSPTDGEDSLCSVIDGLHNLLKTIQDALNSKVFGNQLPLLGKQLQNSTEKAVNFLTDLEDDILTPLKEICESEDDITSELIEQALFKALGPDGVNLLRDLDGDGNVNSEDIQVTRTDDLNFKLKLGGESTFNTNLDTNIGIPGLGLDVGGNLKVELGYEFNLDFGINKDKKFYFNTSNPDEVKIDLDVSLPNLEATGDLGFLQLDVWDQGTRFDGGFAIDLSKDLDEKLQVDAKLNGAASVNLGLVTSFNGEAKLPSISSDFSLNWLFNSAKADPTQPQSFGTKPTIAFNNVKLDLGTFISDFASPVLKNVQKITKPVEPIIDILEKDIDLKVAKFNLLDIAQGLGYIDQQDRDFIESVSQIVTIVNSIPTNGSTIQIGLGSFNLGNDADIRDPQFKLSDVEEPNITETADALDDQLSGTDKQTEREFITKLSSVPGGGLQFPILTDPKKVFNLLLGKDVELFTYDLPKLEFNLEYSQFFPIFGPLGARIRGNIGAGVDLAFGYDTYGLRQFIDTKKGADIFNGFYVSDTENPDGTGLDVPEVTLDASLEASAELNIVVASAGVGGGIYGNIDFNLNDPNNDGKVRVNEFAHLIEENPLCIFDTSGEITAGLNAYVKFGIKPLQIKKRFDSPRITIAEFNSECDDSHSAGGGGGGGTQPPLPISATLLGSGVLRLNMGSNAANRINRNTNDGDEIFTVEHQSGSSGNETLLISAFNTREEYSGVSKIVANGGEKDDIIELKDNVLTPAELAGGNGDDLVTGGSGNDFLEGGNGFDLLDGRNSNDTLRGGADDDWLIGGAGADTLDGGDGDDTASYETATTGILLNLATGEATGDAAGDVFQSIEQYEGSLHNDTLIGNDNDNLLGGLGGNDTLEGGAGSDVLDGSDGNDTLRGGAGNDSLIGGAGADILDGGEGKDFVSYATASSGILINLLTGETKGDAQGDVFQSIEEIEGSYYADTLVGDAANNILRGLGGNDSLQGGAGNDTLSGDAGDDRLIGGAGADTLNGGEGYDVASYQTATTGISINLATGKAKGDAQGDVFQSIEEIEGSSFNDTLVGDTNKNILFGADGNDTLEGRGGADTLRGGQGNDTYKVDGRTDGGSKIQDSGGSNDILNFSNIKLSLSAPVAGKAGLARDGNALIIDINQDGKVDSTKDLTIDNFFSPRNFSINDVTLTEGNNGITNAVFAVSATSGIGKGGAGFIEKIDKLSGSDILKFLPTVSVDYSIANGIATAGIDYNSTNGQLTFSESETQKTITVEVIGDTTIEKDETFFVNLSNASNTDITKSQGIGIIKNDDILISISDVTLTEGNGGLFTPNQKAVFTVSLSGASTEMVIVDFETQSNIASADTDYKPTKGKLIFKPGEKEKTITVEVKGDKTIENDETFFVKLSNASNAIIVDEQGVGTILNDDFPVVNFGASSYSSTEDSSDTIINIPITLSETPLSDVTVAIAINSSSSATLGASKDYTLSTTSLTFPAGATGEALTQNVAVTIKSDNIAEDAETVILTLGTITGAIAGKTAVTTLTIGANDAIAYAISANAASVTEGNSSTTPISFTVTRSGGTDAASSINYEIEGTATNGSDYNNIGGTSGARSTTGTINFAAGETARTITMDVLGDTAIEANDAITVTLSNPVAPGPTATITTQAASTTIVNDDVTSALRRVSVASDGTQGNDSSYNISSISADGRYVAFESFASSLVSGDTNDVADIFINDLQTGVTKRISVASDGTQRNNHSQSPSISADGRYVAFYSGANNLVSGDTNYAADIFVNDLQTGTTRRISVASDGTLGNDYFYHANGSSISVNGRYVAFYSDSINSGDRDIFVNDSQTGVTKHIAVVDDGTQGGQPFYSPSISANGYVAFYSTASNLVSGDTNGAGDIFVNDLQTGVTKRISVASDGTQGNNHSQSPSISADGRYVAFHSTASNLVSGDTNGTGDVFVNDLQTGTTKRISVASDGTQGNGNSGYLPSISADGRYVAFESTASNLVSGDTNNTADIFVNDLQAGTTKLISIASDGTQGNSWSDIPSISADGSYVVFASDASNLVSGDTNNLLDIFVYDRGYGTQKSWAGTPGNDSYNYTGTDNFSGSGLAGSDTLLGGIGNDSLAGGDGNDILVGGFGNDTLTGGPGIDKFTFNSPTDGTDTISDFNAGEGDQIQVSASGFAERLAVGNLSSSQFTIGSSATDAGDRFIYNSSTGGLFFDPDGNGLQGQVQLAVLNSNPALSSSNIFVVA